MTRTGVDWDRVRSRLRSSERALEEALAESPERIAATYRQRARRLAAPQNELRPASAGLPALVFRLGGSVTLSRSRKYPRRCLSCAAPGRPDRRPNFGESSTGVANSARCWIWPLCC